MKLSFTKKNLRDVRVKELTLIVEKIREKKIEPKEDDDEKFYLLMI